MRSLNDPRGAAQRRGAYPRQRGPGPAAPDLAQPTSQALFGPLSDEALIAEKVQVLRKVDASTAQSAALLAGGSLSRALELDLEELGRRKDVIERFEALSPNDARGWLLFAEDFGKEREDAELTLNILFGWLRDLTVAHAGGEHLLHQELSELARTRGAARPAWQLHRWETLLLEAQNAIRHRNGAARLQFERMLIEMWSGEVREGARG